MKISFVKSLQQWTVTLITISFLSACNESDQNLERSFVQPVNEGLSSSTRSTPSTSAAAPTSKDSEPGTGSQAPMSDDVVSTDDKDGEGKEPKPPTPAPRADDDGSDISGGLLFGIGAAGLTYFGASLACGKSLKDCFSSDKEKEKETESQQEVESSTSLSQLPGSEACESLGHGSKGEMDQLFDRVSERL